MWCEVMMRIALVAALFLGIHLVSSSQSHAQVRAHIFLPRTRGATVLSTYIDSQARYNAAAGDYLESVAVARVLHAEARLKETQAFNSEIESRRKWLKYYFEKKLLWRDYRRQLNPSFLEKERASLKRKNDLLTNNPAIVMKNDLIGTMNWMLVQLATDRQAQVFLFSDAGREEFKHIDFNLTEEDVAGLTLCLIERSNGQQIHFRADRGSSLTSAYPLSLRKTNLQEKLARFEQLKEQIGEDCRDGSIDYSTLEATEFVIGQFRQALDREYPRKQRMADSSVYFEHKAGVDFLEVQQAAIRLAVESNNVSGLNGDYAFHGDGLLQLLNHMARRGMQFAKPSQGKRFIYQKIFLGMRDIYLSLEFS
jgi:hypothetical protein